jgi:hypothetical protein
MKVGVAIVTASARAAPRHRRTMNATMASQRMGMSKRSI